MLEITRRVIVAAGLCSAIWLALWQPPEIVQVRVLDFARQLERKIWFDDRPTLEQYIARETRTGMVEIPDAGTKDALIRAVGFLAGDREDPELRERLSIGYFRDSLYFTPEEAPVSGLIAHRRTATVAVPSGGRQVYLSVAIVPRSSSSRDAPSHLAYPCRSLAGWIALASLALYILLPWSRWSRSRAMYSRLRGAILPDVCGVLLGPLFFALPLCVVASGSIAGALSDGYTTVTLIALVVGTGGWVLFAVAAWYAAFCVEVLADRLRVSTLFSTTDLPFAEVSAVRSVVYRPPAWLVSLGALVSLANWRAAGPTLLLASRADRGVEVVTRSGARTRFWLTGMLGGPQVIAALVGSGVAVPEEVIESVGRADPAEPGPRRATRAFQAGGLIALAVVGVALSAWSMSARRAELARPVSRPTRAPLVRVVRTEPRQGRAK